MGCSVSASHSAFCPLKGHFLQMTPHHAWREHSFLSVLLPLSICDCGPHENYVRHQEYTQRTGSRCPPKHLTWKFTAAWIIVSKKCASTDEWINKTGSIHMMDYSAPELNKAWETPWKCPAEFKQPETKKHTMYDSFTWASMRQKAEEREPGVGRGWDVSADRYRVSLWS